VKTTIATLNKKGENTIPALIDALEAVAAGKGVYYGIITQAKQVIEKDANKLNRQNVDSAVALGYVSSKPRSQINLQSIKQEDAAYALEGTIYSSTKILHSETLNAQVDHAQTVTDFLKEAEGDYTLITIEEERLLASRDPIGVQPLYYGENHDLAATASNRRALWELGIREVKSFPPGHFATVTREGFRFEPIKTLTYTKPQPLSMGDAAQKLQQLLERSVQMRVAGLKEVAVAFSGGVDSSIIAFLAKKFCPSVQLIHVSLENQLETEEAWEAAQALNLPLQIHLFKETDVEETVPKVLDLIEEPEPLKVNVGVPFYWTAEKIAQAKLRVLLAGQGADELFGGYQRYVKEYLREGDEKVRQTMFNDVAHIHESNLERDMKICSFHNVQLRLPFTSYELVKWGLSLPTELKIEKKSDSLRKLVLRKVATDLGIPESIAQKPKKAVQYSTGISGVLKKLAKKQNTTLGCYLIELFQKQHQQSRKIRIAG